MTSSVTSTPIGRTEIRCNRNDSETFDDANITKSHGLGRVFSHFRRALPRFPPEADLRFREVHPPDLHYSENALAGQRNDNVRLTSLMQSWWYFRHADEVVGDAFQFRQRPLADADEFVRFGSVRRTPSGSHFVYVSVHIKRTDIIDKYSIRIKPISLVYIKKAVRIFRVRFVIVSDDVDWSKQHPTITGSDLACEGRAPRNDLAILANCNHSIITAGKSVGW